MLFRSVSPGTPVYLVKQPIKVGWLDNTLYIEAHPDLEGDEISRDQRYALALQLIQKANNNEIPDFDQTILNDVLTKLDGEPTALYERLPPLEEVSPTPPIEPPEAAPMPVKAAPTKLPAKSVVAKAKPAAPVTKLTNIKPAKTVGKTAKAAPDKPAPAKLAKGKSPIDKIATTKQAKTKVAKAEPVKPAKAKTTVKTASAKPAATARKGSPGGYYRGS